MRRYLTLFVLNILVVRMAYSDGSKPDMAQKAIEVFTDIIKDKEIYDPVHFGGYLKTADEIRVPSLVGGVVVKIFSKEGKALKKGTPIIAIQPSGNGSDYRTVILKSPQSGNLIHLTPKVGDYVSIGSDVATIGNRSRLIATFQVSSFDLPMMQVGTPLTIEVHNKSEIEGKIAWVASTASEKTGTFEVEVQLACDPTSICATLPLGSLVKAVYKSQRRRGIVIPLRYLRKGGKLAIIEEQGKSKHILVQLGQFFGDDVEVTAGLTAGQHIITHYSRFPKPGEPVKIKPAKEVKHED